MDSSETAIIPSNVGLPVSVDAGGFSRWLGGAETLLLPAACGRVEIQGPADVLMGYLPDLGRDVREPPTAAGYGPGVIAALGEVPGARRCIALSASARRGSPRSSMTAYVAAVPFRPGRGPSTRRERSA